jgi:hypothetical protein
MDSRFRGNDGVGWLDDCFCAAHQHSVAAVVISWQATSMVDIVTAFSGQPYRLRTWLRQRIPFWLIDMGFASKGVDCEAKRGKPRMV